MIRSLVTTSLFVSAAFAASSTSSASSSLPTGISSSCSTFLTSLNSNSDISTCASSIVSATSDFVNATTSSSSTISSALGTICSSSSSCSDTAIRTQLSSFYSSCSTELTQQNTDVIAIYDMLYVLEPLQTAICAKDDSGNYCALETSSAASALDTSVENVQKYISTDTGAANITTFSTSYLPFLFLSPNLSEDALCVACTRSILTSYISFMSDIAYAPGVQNSVLLNKESALYQNVTSTCGSSFLSGSVQAAGSLGSGSTDNGAAQLDVRSLATAVLGMASVVLAFN